MMVRGALATLLAFLLTAGARAERGRIAPHIIDQIRDRDSGTGRYDQPAQIPLELPVGPPPGWQPPELDRDSERVPELDRRDIDRDDQGSVGSQKNSRVIEIDMNGEEPSGNRKPAAPASAAAKKNSPAAIGAALKAIETGDSRELDAIFGENRFAAVDALAFVASGMEQSLRAVDNATVLAEQRMVDVPKKPDPKNPNVRLFYPQVQHALLLRPDVTADAARVSIQSLVDARKQAINDPPELTRKLLAHVFGLMPSASIERALSGWTDIPRETAQFVRDALKRLEPSHSNKAHLQSFVEEGK